MTDSSLPADGIVPSQPLRPPPGEPTTVMRCNGVAEALAIKGCLVAAGIPATIGDNNLMMQGGEWMAGGVGNVRVLVPESMLSEAQEVLAEFRRGEFALEGDADPALAPPTQATDLALWSPDMAALFSVIFTPIFGAVLHVMNSRRLGEPRLVSIATFWLVASLVATAAGFWLLRGLTWTLMRPFGVSVLLMPYSSLWYFAAAHAQSRFVARSFGTKFVHRKLPLASALAAAAMLAVGAIGLAAGSD